MLTINPFLLVPEAVSIEEVGSAPAVVLPLSDAVASAEVAPRVASTDKIDATFA